MASDALKGGPLSRRLEQVCSSCDGTGATPSPAWDAWDSEYARMVHIWAGAESEPALRDVVAQMLSAHEGTRPREERERPCEDCGGAGTVATEEGETLLAFLRRHLP